MAKEICISSTPHETRLAILEDDQLAEIYYERENEYTLAGSIYKGRVTRVLPGMQSAFVDLGLERDAFLYVTDFIELDDLEDTEELEKATASGAAMVLPEARRTSGARREEPLSSGRQGAPRSDIREAEVVKEPPEKERRWTTGAASEAAEAGASAVEFTTSTQTGQEASSSAAGRRWRGRRHRRGRGPAVADQGQPDFGLSETVAAEADLEAQTASQIHASAGTPAGKPAGAAGHFSETREPSPVRAPGARTSAPAPFVLPGESLSKYGGAPAPEPPASVEAPARDVSTSKPSTLVEAPIEWDGSGLLPGESLTLHRSRGADPLAERTSQLQAEAAPEPERDESPEMSEDVGVAFEVEGEEEEIFEETEESRPPALDEIATALPGEPVAGFHESPPEEAPLLPALAEEGLPGAEIEEEPEADALPGALASAEAGATEEASPDPETDASASHRVDSARPLGFRLFGLGGKKGRKDAEPDVEKPAPATTEPAPSAYAPGLGLVEEEVIEGAEVDSHLRQRNPEWHDGDEYEEETLPAQIRSGDLGELLQEAHLDHRIQMELGQKGGEEEVEPFDIEEEAEEQAAETQPASPREGTHPRRDRAGRGHRGRGMQGPGPRRGPSRRSMQTSDLPVISELLKPGQEILVQIAKEPIAKKGARITSHIALPGRFLVFMPTVSHVGVSRKIASDEERHRLKRILTHERGEASGGFIVRTAAEGASEEELRADLRFLMNLWNEIKQRSEDSQSPALIYHDLSLIERILRDQVSANFSNIWVDSEADYERIVRFLNRFSPSLVRRAKLYTKDTPLFEHFGIQEEISKALRSKVWLKSGGSIVINQTEALVAIDINTGKYVGKSARLEDTILKTNLDAVPEIVRQIRLRDLGGIIVIDFIDMDERKNRFKVMAALEEALKSDRAPTKVLQFNDFGLVAITRKRVKQSLERTLSVPCPTCQATGMVKSPTTVCNEMYIELRKMRRHLESSEVMLRVNPEVVKVLKSNGGRWLTDFEELVGRNVLVKSDPTLHPEQFDIQG
jgi:Rne/Rng family ribonuclease